MQSFYLSTRKCSEQCGSNQITQPKICDIKNWFGRTNRLTMVECSEDFDATIVADITKWQSWYDASSPKAIVLQGGFGEIGQNVIRSVDSGSCDGEETSEIQYKITWQQKKYDLVDFTTHEFINGLIRGGYAQYNLIAHYCKGADMVLPIGKFIVKVVDDLHSGSVETEHITTLEFIWTPESLSIPVPMKVAGISSVVPTW